MRRMIFIVFLGLFTSSLLAQNPFPNKWKLKKVGVSFGFDRDMMQGMTHQKLLETAKGEPRLDYNNIPFTEEDVYSMICENPNIRLEATLLPPGARNTEIRLAVNTIFDRIDGIQYQGINPTNGQWAGITYDSYSNEVAIEAAWLYRLEATPFLNFYGGGGMNAGFTFGSEIDISGYNLALQDPNSPDDPSDIPWSGYYYEDMYHYYDKKESFTRRVFAQLGVSLVIGQRIELGYEKRLGLGANWSPFANSMFTTRLNSNAMTIKYHFKFRNAR